MNKPVTALAALLVVAAGGYSALWFKKADDFKAAFVASAHTLNEKMQPMLKTGTFFTYEGVEAAGFPFKMKLSVKKPALNVPVSSLLRTLPREEELKEISADYDWVEAIAYAQDITITSNLMGSAFTLVANGDRSHQSIVNGEVRQSLISSSATPMVCHLETPSTGFLLTRPVFTDAKSIIDSFHSVDCGTTGLVMKDTKGQELSSSEAMYVAFTNKVANTRRSATLKTELKNTRYTPEFDAVVNNYLHIGSEVSKTKQPPLPYSFSELGEGNGKIDIAYEGPESIEGFETAKVNMNLTVNAFDFSTALAKTENRISLHLAAGDTEREAAISVYSKSNVSARYDEILRKQTEQTIRSLAADTSPAMSHIAQELNRLGPPDALAQALVPQLHEMGDLVFNFDAKMQGPLDAGAFFTQGHLTLNGLDVMTSTTGIKSKGEFVGANGRMPSGNFQLSCIDCDSLVDRMGNYIITSVNYINASEKLEHRLPNYSPDLINGVKRFLHSIAVNGRDPNAKNLEISFTAKPTGEMDVSGKPPMELMQSYMANVAPYIPKINTPDPDPMPEMAPITPDMMPGSNIELMPHQSPSGMVTPQPPAGAPAPAQEPVNAPGQQE